MKGTIAFAAVCQIFRSSARVLEADAALQSTRVDPSKTKSPFRLFKGSIADIASESELRLERLNARPDVSKSAYFAFHKSFLKKDVRTNP